MKKIETIIRTSKLEAVKEALAKNGITIMYYTDVKGLGTEKSEQHTYRGVTYDEGYIARTKLEFVVSEHNVQRSIDAVVGAAKTGEIGDGKVFVFPIEQSIRIRTGETGEASL